MTALFIGIQNLFRSKRGQGMVEYGLIIGLIAIAVITVLGLMSDELQQMFQTIVNRLTAAQVP
ncbi:MAG: Flp family type IVb pilin [Bacillota bacterium]